MCSRRSTRGSGVVKHVASRALVRLRMPATEKADGRAAATRRGVVHLSHRGYGWRAGQTTRGRSCAPTPARACIPPTSLPSPSPPPEASIPSASCASKAVAASAAAAALPSPAALAADIAIAIARAARHPVAADRPVLRAAVQHAPRRAGSQHGPSGGPLHRRRGYVVAVAARCVAAQAAPSSRRAPVPVDISNIIIYGRGRACAC